MKEEQVELYLSLLTHTASPLPGKRRESNDYILQLRSRIMGSYSEGPPSEDRELCLGELSFFIIRVGEAVNDKASLYSVFDEYQETNDLSEALFTRGYSDFREKVEARYDAAVWCDDLLLLRSLSLAPAVRGQSLEFSVIDTVIRDWSSGCSLVVLDPDPCCFEYEAAHQVASPADGPREATLKTGRAATKRVRKHYGRMGFERVGHSRFFALCPHEQRDISKLDLPDHALVSLSFVHGQKPFDTSDWRIAA